MKYFVDLNDFKLINQYKFTNAEIKVLQLLMEGSKRKEIGGRLNLSVHTVNSHIENIYKKLEVHNEVAAIFKVLNLIPLIVINKK